MTSPCAGGAHPRSRIEPSNFVPLAFGIPRLRKAAPPRRRHWKLAACTLAVLGVLAQPVWAAGGAGGSGGAGGADTAVGSGILGLDSDIGGGGGGGAGTIGGAGGTGGTVNGPAGDADGGLGGMLPGGAGIDGAIAPAGFVGGGGGGGAHGAVVTSSGPLTNTSPLAGGKGGNGGGSSTISFGGGGGAGGYGVVLDGSGLSYTNQGEIQGGAGGAGGSATFANGGGGSGGIGVDFTGSGTLNNSGTITGGAGGAGGSGPAVNDGASGADGAGVQGAGLTIINSGTISGGGQQGDAIRFTGGTNTLELNQGYEINGAVDATAGTHNTLILGGTGGEDFDVRMIGVAQYQGFSAFEKTGTGTWTLTNSTSEVTPWTLSGGTLSIDNDLALGDASGGLTFDGGTLRVTAALPSLAFDSSRAITLKGAGTIEASGSSTVKLDGVISGPGSLTLTGTGNVDLGGANTYQGGTNVYIGVYVLATGALGTGAVTVQGGVSGGFNYPFLSFKNDASAGDLPIRNVNNGLTLFEQGSTAGHATITNAAEGHTEFDDTADAGTATITNQSQGATLFVGQSSAGSASITNEANGALAIMEAATAAGAKVVNQAGGVVDISLTATGTSIGSLSGAGDVGLGGKVLTLGALNQNDTISGAIVDGSLMGLGGPVAPGGGSLVKVGTGTLTLNGANTYTGGTTVQAGTLAVGDVDHASASIAGNVQVDAGGTLRGHGSIAGNVNNTGTVWPGGSIGTLTVGGNYTQSSNGTLQMEVSPTAASQLKVGGTATLAGTLSLLYAPGTYTTKAYTLLSAGSVKGTFSSVTDNLPAGATQGVAYTSTGVGLNLTAAAQPVQPVQPGQPTQLVQPVVVAPTQATIFGAMGGSALRAGQSANEVLLERLAGPCGVAAMATSAQAATGTGQGSDAASTDASSQTFAAGSSASTADASGSAAAQSLSCPRQGNGLWIQAQGTDTRIDGNHGAPDARDRRYGFLTGVDHQWKGMTVGLAGGYSHADVSESGNGSKGTLDTLRLAGYAAKNLGAYTLAGTLGYAYDFSSTTRSFGALGAAKGDGHGQEFTAGLQASRPWSLGPVVLTPRVGVRYAYLDGLSTNETGPTAQNLGVGSQHLQSLQPYVGVTLDYPFTLHDSDRPASIQLRAGYAYETQSTGRDVSVTAADGTGFVIAGTRDTRGLVTAGLGATLPIGKSASAYVRYDSVLHTGNVNAQSLQAGVDYRF